MTIHLKWAIAATAAYLVVGLLCFLGRHDSMGVKIAGIVLSIVAAGMLAVTGWYGGENVYRFGLGVHALPVSGSHHHEAGESTTHDHGAGESASHDHEMGGDKSHDHDHKEDGHSHD